MWRRRAPNIGAKRPFMKTEKSQRDPGELPKGKEIVMSKMCPVVHFEMPYEQSERMAPFYQKAFGWQTQMLGEQMAIMCSPRRRKPTA